MNEKFNSEDLKEKQISVIYDLIKQEPSGILVSSLEEALRDVLPVALNRRTLLRRLALMKDRGKIVTQGSGNKVYYQTVENQPASEFTRRHAFSSETKQILSYTKSRI